MQISFLVFARFWEAPMQSQSGLDKWKIKSKEGKGK
jgi:hypothetical protein